jgi:uncharacterized protein YprB with RNaseH-like and TPR domain
MAKIDRTVEWLAGKARSETRFQRPEFDTQQGSLPLESAFPEAVVDPSGCLTIDRCVSLSPPALRGEGAAQALLAELRLVYGIGKRYTERLREGGYTSIFDLCTHPRWRSASTALLSDWGAPFDLGAVHRSLERWLPSSEPLYLQSLGLVPVEELLFFDLETLGLGGSPIFLVAVGRFVEDGFAIRQTLAPSLGEEVALLERTEADLRGASALLSYNGKSFDWTILRERFAYYDLSLPDVPIHVDLLHHARRAFGAEIPDCHLGTVEQHVLGIERSNDLPSAEVPIHYTAYLETGNATYLLPIVDHSRQDLVTLVALLDRLLSVAEDA